MPKEVKHKDAGARLSRTKDNALDRHYIVDGAANDIPVYDVTNAKLVGKTPTEVAALLDHGNLTGRADDDHTQYIKHSLATATSNFLVASGAGVFIKKTLAQVKTLLVIATDIATHAAIKAANATLGHVIVETGSEIDVDASGKLTLGGITGFLEGTPTEDLATKAPTSEWAFDLEAIVTAKSRVVGKATNTTDIADTNRTTTLNWTDLDLTSATSASAKFALMRIQITIDSINGAANCSIGLRKNGDTPTYYPSLRLDSTWAAGGTSLHGFVIVELDSGQVCEYTLTATGTIQFDTYAMVLGYIE